MVLQRRFRVDEGEEEVEAEDRHGSEHQQAGKVERVAKHLEENLLRMRIDEDTTIRWDWEVIAT